MHSVTHIGGSPACIRVRDLLFCVARKEKAEANGHWFLFNDLHKRKSQATKVHKASPFFSTRQGVSLCCLNEKFIYLLGGVTDWDDEKCEYVYRYDIRSDSWTTLPEMNKARYRFGSCILENYIYVSSGLVGLGTETTIERL